MLPCSQKEGAGETGLHVDRRAIITASSGEGEGSESTGEIQELSDAREIRPCSAKTWNGGRLKGLLFGEIQWKNWDRFPF